MVAQDDVLASHIANKSLGHSYLFTGPGSEAASEHFIKSLLCRSPASLSACGECESCRLFLKNPELVIHIVDCLKNGGIDEVRKIRAEAFLTTEKNKNIFLVRFPERMSREASSAMLKIVEEPPRGVLFVFLAENPFSIHPSLRSRMVTFRSNKEQSYAYDSMCSRVLHSPLPERFREAKALAENSEAARVFVRDCILMLERELRESVDRSYAVVPLGNNLQEACRALFLLEHSRMHPRLVLNMFLGAWTGQD